MPLILDIKNPDGTRAKAYASCWESLSVAIKIVDDEMGQKGAWCGMLKPHRTQKPYKWEVPLDDGTKATVVLEQGSTIQMYRQ